MNTYVKYPRTHQLPFSQSDSSDDVWWKTCANFEGKEVVITEKLDGECTTIYPDGHVHARSLDSAHHASRSWVKALASQISFDIPKGWRICGENLYAWHSIFYDELPTYFFTYGVYDDNICLSWNDTVELCAILELETVPVLFRGVWDEKFVREFWTGKGTFPTFATKAEAPVYPDSFFPCEAEGYVVRLAEEFSYNNFRECVAKFVRKNHVTTPTNWMTREVIPNRLQARAG